MRFDLTSKKNLLAACQNLIAKLFGQQPVKGPSISGSDLSWVLHEFPINLIMLCFLVDYLFYWGVIKAVNSRLRAPQKYWRVGSLYVPINC